MQASLLLSTLLLLCSLQTVHSGRACKLEAEVVDAWYDTRFKNISLTEPSSSFNPDNNGQDEEGSGENKTNLFDHHTSDRALSTTSDGFQMTTHDTVQQKVIKLEAKRCSCMWRRPGERYENSDFYCIIQREENYCNVPSYHARENGATPVCYKRTMKYSTARNFWYPAVMVTVIYFTMLFTTRCGKHAMVRPFSLCFPKLNRLIVERVIREEAETRNTIREQIEESNRREDGMEEHHTLVLKTKSFDSINKVESRGDCASNEEDSASSPNSRRGEADASFSDYPPNSTCTVVASSDKNVSKDEQGELPTCSICMTEVEDGDRIGDLPCTHSFHVECLKEWVLWRNTCPLCQNQAIATHRVSLRPVTQASTAANAAAIENRTAGQNEANDMSLDHVVWYRS